jgi:NodT family efflux transporter outer membrane factor (OMF) lipoprotein
MRKVLLAVVLLSAACSPGYTPPPTKVAPSYRGATQTTFSAESLSSPFWFELGDSALVRLVEEAIRANPDVNIAEARVREARANRTLSALDFAPAITARGGYTKQRLPDIQLLGVPAEFRSLAREIEYWDAGFDASWEVDIFGRVRKTVSARTAFIESAQGSLHNVQLSLAAELARTYIDLRGAQSELTVVQDNVNLQQKTFDLTQERLNAGRGTALDVERQRSQLELTRSNIPVLDARIVADQNRIALLMGRTPDSLPPDLVRATPLPSLPDLVRLGTPAELVKNRPDVVAAERQLAAESALTGAASAEYLPRFQVNGNVGLTASSFDSLSKSGSSRFLIAPVVTWPFLDLGRVKANVDATRAVADQARAQYRGTVLAALEETESAIATYDRARARLASLSASADASTKAFDLAQLRFREGAADFLEVLDVQRTAVLAQDQLVQGRTDAAVALVALYKATGGAWRGEAK